MARSSHDDLPKGNYVAPTVVAGLPPGHRLFKDELFVPFVAVAPVDDLDEALKLANDTEYGLTAGFFSTDQAEVDRFLDRIEAGVVYVNRKAGATTGAWPGVQPFGGWKGSGSSGKAGGGLYYVQQFMREQSQTVISIRQRPLARPDPAGARSRDRGAGAGGAARCWNATRR